MSPKIFKGPLGSGELEKGASYKHGSGEYDAALAGNLVKLYSSGGLKKMYPHWAGKGGFKDLVEVLEPRIALQANIEGMNANLFLEDIASCIIQGVELSGRATVLDRSTVFNTLLDPVMQVLYRHGHDELDLNLSLFPPDYMEVGGQLEGDEKRILRLTCRGTFEDVGFSVKHVRLELYGTSKWAGACAHSSEFILHEPVKILGLNASNCTYHHLTEHHEGTILEGENNRFYFHKGLSEEIQTRIWRKQNARKGLGERDVLCRDWGHFFNNGNQIFIPKGEDDWEEIVPYRS